MNGIIITNNPKVKEKYSKCYKIVFLEAAGLMEVLYLVRDKIHEGHGLLSHPLSGSVKPGQTIYKSVMITKEKSELDIAALKITENSIAVAEKLLKDYQLIDLDLIAGGIDR